MALLAGAVALTVAYAAAVQAVEWRAQKTARAIAGRLDAEDDPDRRILELTRLVHQSWITNRGRTNHPLLLRFAGLLSSRAVPATLRLDAGALEVIFLEGQCGNASRALSYLLNAIGDAARPLNIVTRETSHAALQVTLASGRRLMVDPFYGVVPMKNGRILSPEDLQQGLAGGDPGIDLRALSGHAETKFYRDDFPTALFAPEGTPLEISVQVDVPKDGVTLGALDGNDLDVAIDGARNHLTTYWAYLGHRFSRSFVRKFTFNRPVRVLFTLAEEADPDFVVANRPARISGREVRFALGKGEPLVFRDRRAPRDWLKLRSYQPVDMVRIMPREVP